jgi:transcriptional regulator with XRE-family HTH domain
MTLARFAKRLAISAANLSDLEQGRKIPSPSSAAKIALELGLPEMGLISIAIEDALLKEGLKYKVRLDKAA